MNTDEKLTHHYKDLGDGLILASGFFYPQNENISAFGIFYAKNLSCREDRWDTIKIVIKNVSHVKLKWSGNQPNSISTGVSLSLIDEQWCLDIDGIYDNGEPPKAVSEILEYGECYAIGRDVELHIIPNQRADLLEFTTQPTLIKPMR